MSIDRHSHAEQKNLIEDPDECARQEARNGILQFELLLETARQSIEQAGTKPFELRPSTILRLQECALRDIHRLAGTFRNTPISITGSKHAPPDWPDVSEKVNALCAYVNSNFEHKTAVHLSSYILWKLNWIHPFADGNGRTARAVSYLVLLVKLGIILPGTPTIPEQIAADKGPYYDALEAADAGFQSGTIDVSALETMLESMLINQLTSRPTLPQKELKNVGGAFLDRIQKAPAELLAKCYGSEEVANQLWSVGDHIVLQVSSFEGIAQSEHRSCEDGNPFPRLLAIGSAPAEKMIDSILQGAILVDEKFITSSGYALQILPDVYVTLQGGTITEDAGNKWDISGTLYIARMGSEIKEENLANIFDFMISKHLSVMGK